MNFNPNWVSVPGDTIKSILEVKGYSIDHLSEKINRSKYFVENLIEGNEAIDHNLANSLSTNLGFNDTFWLNREFIYREKLQQLEHEWQCNLPIKDMVKEGLIPKVAKKNNLKACLDFFGVKSLVEWNKKYRNQIPQFAFRKSQSFITNPYSVAVWFRQAENFIKNLQVSAWDKVKFENKLPELKKLSREKRPVVFLPELIKECAKCGVKIAIVRSIDGNRASGATKFIDGNPLIILSFRYLTDDHFWFTFFHEAGHLILHSDNQMRIEVDSCMNEEEEEANIFAQLCLIPDHIEKLLPFVTRTKRNIIKLSQEAGISPGILVGQMQNRGIISKSYLNSYKRYYSKENIDEAIQVVQKMINL